VPGRVAAGHFRAICENQPSVMLMPVRLTGWSIVTAHPKRQPIRQRKRWTMKNTSHALPTLDERADSHRRRIAIGVLTLLWTPRTWRRLFAGERCVVPLDFLPARKRGSDLLSERIAHQDR